MKIELDPQKWAQANFGACQLGDKRRTRRAVQVAAQVASDPDASTPVQTEQWADLKAAYRLIDEEDVTFDALGGCHWELTRNRTRGTYLVIGDTTELDFGYHRKIEGASKVGNGWAKGFLLHSGLMVDAESEEVIGLAGQVVRHRVDAPRGENAAQRIKRSRESEIWGELVEKIGWPRGDARYIHIFDSGADNFEVYCRVLDERAEFVIRGCQMHRKVLHEGEEITFDERISRLPLAGSYQLEVRANKKQPARTAKIEVRYGSVTVKAPQHRSPWLKRRGTSVMKLQVVEVREIDPPKGAKPLRWVLLTTLPVESFDDAWLVIGYYEKRPLVEEFHKVLKTGCRVETRQYRTSERLETVTALLSVVGIRLLQLRSLARTQPDRPVEHVVPRRWIAALKRLRRQARIETVRDFFRSLAGLGGFLGRKSDGEPGWITLWRGLEKLQLAVRALTPRRLKCG